MPLAGIKLDYIPKLKPVPLMDRAVLRRCGCGATFTTKEISQSQCGVCDKSGPMRKK